ncbi:MAG: hypothetical protein ABMA13_22705 [Chthoniobacteraceae bacterium]
MTSRERTLATLVGTLVALLVTFVLGKTFLNFQRQLTRQIEDKTTTLAAMRTLISERTLWEQRDQWLTQIQPKLDNANSAGVALLDKVKELGQARNLTPTEPVLSVPEGGKTAGKAAYQAVSVSFNVKGKWEDLVNFLYDVQTPVNFLVFEKATLQLDKEDKSQVSGSFKLAKWFAAQ